MFFRKLFARKKEKKQVLDNLSELSDYINGMIQNGFNEKHIKKTLLSAGWPKEVVKKGLSVMIKEKKEDISKQLPDELSVATQSLDTDSKINIPELKKEEITVEKKTLNVVKSNQPEKVKNVKKKPEVEKKVLKVKPTQVKKEKPTVENKDLKVNKKPKVAKIHTSDKSRKIKKVRGGTMPKKINSDEAKTLLREVAPENSFWTPYGAIFKSLDEFSAGIKQMDDEKFANHVNKEKNDFAKWIGEVIGDSKLAKELSKSKTKQAALKKLNTRLKYLKQIAG